MQMRFFIIPLKNIGEAEAELNAFLLARRVVAVERRFVDAGENSYWALAVEHLEPAAEVGRGSASGGRSAGKERIDYKEVLPPEDFAVFSRLREVRKALAEEDGVPLYAVLSNEQLAAIATSRPKSLSELMKVDGLGEGKAKKFGGKLLAVVEEAAAQPASKEQESSVKA